MKRLGLAFLFALVAASTCSALLWIQPSRFAGGGGGGGGPVVAHVVTGGTSGGVTSASVDTTGANLIVIAVCGYLAAPTPTDSKGNTWTVLASSDTTFEWVRMYYCVAPTVGSGHTFSSTAAYGSIGVIALSGMSGGFDTHNYGATLSGTTVGTGSITTSQANTVLVSCVGFNTAGTTVSIDNSLTITDQVDNSNGNYYGFAMAYKVLTATTTINATWTANQSNGELSAIMGAFKY